MIIKFKDFDIEKYVLAACLQGPAMWRNFPPIWLEEEISRKTYKEFQKFLAPPLLTFPTANLVIEKTEDLDIKLFVKELEQIKVDRRELNVRINDLFEMYASRKMIEVAESIPNDIEKVKISELVRSKISQLTGLVNPLVVGQRVRGFIYDKAQARWLTYKELEQNPNLFPGIPYGILELDRYTNGGLRPGFIVMFFAESSGYKTKVKLNLAYNFSFLAGKDVMVLSLEVPKDDYEHMIDSRHALTDYDAITRGKLPIEDREKYRQSLISMDSQKPSLYIVDIPSEATSADIIKELELYYVKVGKYPDIVILDYLNEMSPMSTWNNTSEKFKNLGTEIRAITRSYKISFITSMQENREGKRIKDKEKVGLEHIGESHYFQNVCHLVIHLYQDAEGIDELSSQLHWSIKKNRYGRKNVSFTTFANPAINYVGDYSVIRKE